MAEPPHRAGADAYLCALLLEKIMQQPHDLDAMVRWSNGLALLPRCPLFAHKGKKWADVPTSYLDWIVNKPNDVSRDVKANAKLELGKRT
jgi:exodeoxyribonuclease X